MSRLNPLSATLRRRGAEGVAYVVTAGGTKGSNEADVVAARRHLSGQRVFFSKADSPYVDLAILRGFRRVEPLN